MDEQDSIISYDNNGLGISEFREGLEIAKPLKGRQKYRAVEMSEFWGTFNTNTTDILLMNESMDKIEEFREKVNSQLDSYCIYLLDCIKEFKAWNVINLETSDYSFEAFEILETKDKIKKIEHINNKYKEFLRFQKLADIRDYFNIKELTDENVKKMKFTIDMFDSFKNEQIKREFFCFDKDFLMTLIAFNKSKKIRLDDYMRSKNKTIQDDYERYLVFYKLEDFREIIEKVVSTSKTAKISISKVVDIFQEISETDAELEYINVNGNEIKKIEEKEYRYTRLGFLQKREELKANQEIIKKAMEEHGIVNEDKKPSSSSILEKVFFEKKDERAGESAQSLLFKELSHKSEGNATIDIVVETTEKQESIKEKKDSSEDNSSEIPVETQIEEAFDMPLEAAEEKIEEIPQGNEQNVEENSSEEPIDKAIETKLKEIIKPVESSEEDKDDDGEKEKLAQEIESRIEENVKEISYNTSKEPIIPLIFSWFERDDITFTRRVTIRKLGQFYEKLKKIERDNGARVSLYLITNANKEVTLKRLIEMQKKAINNGFPNLVEGALGGYSSFKVEMNGRVTDLSIMSNTNREKIINLLDNTVYEDWERTNVNKECDDYVRYQFSERKERKYTVQYLKSTIENVLKEEKIKNQPLRFIPYSDKSGIGVDVVLRSQLNSISKLSDYYKTKYYVIPEKAIKLNMETFDKFIES